MPMAAEVRVGLRHDNHMTRGRLNLVITPGTPIDLAGPGRWNNSNVMVGVSLDALLAARRRDATGGVLLLLLTLSSVRGRHRYRLRKPLTGGEQG